MNLTNSRLNSIASENHNCYECYAQLLIYPADIHPDQISEHLNLEATKVNVIGDTSTNSLGKVREIKLAGWFLSSEKNIESKDLREHLDWLINKLIPVKSQLASLQDIDNVKMTLCCVWRSRYGHSDPVLWPEQMKNISDLNLECSFDIYFNSDE